MKKQESRTQETENKNTRTQRPRRRHKKTKNRENERVSFMNEKEENTVDKIESYV